MDSDIRKLKGIGNARALAFAHLGVHTIDDLLHFFPRSYEDRSVRKNIDDCVANETVCLGITVSSAVRELRVKRNMAIYSVTITDNTGEMKAVWYNNKYIKNVFSPGDRYIFYGRINSMRGKLQIENPIYEKEGTSKYTGKIVPIYPLTAGLVQKNIQAVMELALEYVGEMKEYIPSEILSTYKIPEINYSMKNIHFPTSLKEYQTARNRFVFEELLILQLALSSRKADTKKEIGIKFNDISGGSEIKKNIPYRLTNAQKQVLTDIIGDLKSGKRMNRLIQGDVGSGKTIIAAMAMFLAFRNGYQSILMAPTEILARQHVQSLQDVFKGLGINIVLLTGSLTKKEKESALEMISDGTADVIVGTHAVIEDRAVYKNLGLVVADEQHRFGVNQRAKLCAKGLNPHMLVMSATPIPRTLALILYGDLDISVIDELPPGRKPVKTYAVDEKMRKRVYNFARKNVADGHQCYIVCPLIEETESVDLENATELSEKLGEMFPEIKVGLIHGKMKPKEKDEIMNEFASGNIGILVSTTVIEVGVNVPNSNLMIIENAERFGLSQLHQLRGRVGRGAEQAYCILFSNGNNETTKKRMETMCKSNDGFYISEQDLKLRGPGDFFGTRQHGLPEMKIANLFQDADILSKAQDCARLITEKELLSTAEYAQLKLKTEKLIENAEILN